MPTGKEPTPKRRFIFKLAGALLLAAGCAHAPRRAPGAVLFLGDSLTAGVGVAPGEAYADLVAADWKKGGLACPVRSLGVPKATTAELLGYLPVVLKGDERLVFLEIGANDGFDGVPAPRIEENLAAIVKQLRARGAEVVLASMKLRPDAPRASAAAFEAIYPRLAKRLGLRLMPSLLDRIYGRPERFSIGDGTHPNAAGHREIAKEIEGWFRGQGLPSPDSCAR